MYFICRVFNTLLQYTLATNYNIYFISKRSSLTKAAVSRRSSKIAMLALNLVTVPLSPVNFFTIGRTHFGCRALTKRLNS